MLSGYAKLYTLIKIIYLHILVLRDIIYTDGEGNKKKPHSIKFRNSLISSFIKKSEKLSPKSFSFFFLLKNFCSKDSYEIHTVLDKPVVFTVLLADQHIPHSYLGK